VPVLLGDLAFHVVCAPRCRACDASLTEIDEQCWTFDGQVVWSPSGYALQPTEHWCDSCRELHDRDIAFAQD
jgi:hypothetical protein